MISTSVSGEVSSSSIVPDRFSSEYVRIVTIGSRNSISTLAFCSSGRISSLFTLRAGGGPNCDGVRADEVVQVDDEEPAEEDREEAHHHPRDRRGEVAAQFLAGNRRDVAHALLMSGLHWCGSGCSSRSSVVSCRKISSRLIRSRPQLEEAPAASTMARATSRRTSTFGSDSTS